MNKLFTKIVGAALGLTMAVGVGVAVSANNGEVVPVHAASSTVTLTKANVTNFSSLSGYDSGAVRTTTGNDWGIKAHNIMRNTKNSPSGSAQGDYIQMQGSSKGNFYNTIAIAKIVSITVIKQDTAAIKCYFGSTGQLVSDDTSNQATSILNNGSETSTKPSAATTMKWTSTMIGDGKTYFALVGGGTHYITSIAIEYEMPSFEVSFAVGQSGYGTVSPSSITNVPSGTSITTNGNQVTINGTTVTATPTADTAQYTYAFSSWSNNTGTVTAARTITANFTRTTKTYGVSGNITNGSLSSTPSTAYGSALNITIEPDSGYVLPDTLTSVTMGGSAYAGYTYNNETGAFSISSVTGAVVITATCPYGGQTYGIDVSIANGSYSGDTEIGDEGEASVTITPSSGYKVPVKSAITVTNAIEWDYTRTSNSSGTISLLGAEGVVTISATCVPLETYSIGVTSGDHFSYTGASSIQEDGNASVTFVPEEGYHQPSDVTVSGASKSWNQSTGVLTLSNPTGNVSITYTPVQRTLTGITISSSSGSYTLGDTFIMPTVTATYNVGGNENVTSKATATGDGLVDGILTEAGNSKTITISYGGYSQTYTAKVTAVVPQTAKFTKVTSGTVTSGKYLIVNETASVAFNGGINSTSYDVTSNIVSVSIVNNEIAYSSAMDAASFTFDSTAGTLRSAAGYYIYRNGTSSGVTAQTTVPSLTTSITVSNGNAVISNVKDSSTMRLRYNNSSGQDRFRYYSSDSVQAIQIYKYQAAVDKTLKWITAEVKSGTYYQNSSVSASDFTVTAHYDDGSTSTPTTGITVTNGELTNIGANEVTLTYSGKSCKVSVTAVEQTATLTGLTWAQGEYVVINNHSIDFSELGVITAEYDDGDSSATKSINQCSVATYTKNGNEYVKVSDLDDGDAITSTSHGKYLGVSYTEGLVTEYAYSSAPIYVVEEIEDVYAQVETTSWSKVTSIKDGDVVTFVNETEAKVASSMGSNIINSTSYEGSIENPMSFEVGKVGNYYTFHNAGGYLGNHSTGTSGNNNAYLDAEIDTEDNQNYFTVSFDEDDNVVITSVKDSNRVLQLRNGTPDRFCFYGSTQTAIQLYKGTTGYSPTGESIANTNAVAQKVVLEYAAHFVEEMNCQDDGSTTSVASKWDGLAEDFDNWFNNGDKDLTPAQVTHAFALFANAYAVEGGDTLQDMLAKYEYIVAKYKLDDFLHDSAARPEVQYSSGRINIFGEIGSANGTAIIVVISLVSLTAIGGYFFLKKRKEQ